MSETGNILESKAKQNKLTIALPAVVLTTSFYYSFSFTGGIVIGYILSKIFCHFFVHNGKIDPIFFEWGKWKIHFHHWIMGIILLAIVWIIDQYYLPTLFAGMVCGMIIQDIYDYNDWHKVIMKKEKVTIE